MTEPISEVRRSLSAGQRAKKVIDRLVQQRTTAELVQLLAQANAADRTLRIFLRAHLATVWPTDSLEYQQAVFCMAAQDVAAGKRAYASELGVGGNEYATLDRRVLEERIASSNPLERIAAAQMMRPRLLPRLCRALEEEPAGDTRDLMERAARRIAGEPGAPASSVLEGPERLAHIARRFGRQKGWVRMTTAAEAIGAPTSELTQALPLEPSIHVARGSMFVAEGGRTPPQLETAGLDRREEALLAAHSGFTLKAASPVKSMRSLLLVWLRTRRQLWLPELRYALGIESLAEACDGVRFLSHGLVGTVLGGQWVGELDINASVVVAHPVDGEDLDWDGAPAWQSNRPVHGADAMPALGADSPEIEHKVWMRRIRKLGYRPVREQKAVVATTRDPMVRLNHSGYGQGYGATAAQRLNSVSYPTSEPAVVSEVVWDVRRILGVDPMKRPKPKATR